MPIVTAHGVHKAYGTRIVLRAADLTVSTGERVGIVGLNGSGKSTLARLLSGLDSPDSGTISRRRGARIRYLDQVPSFDGDPSAEEAVSAALSSWSEALARHQSASAALAAGSSAATALLEEQARAAEDVERLGGWDQRHRVSAMLGHLGIGRPEARISSLSGGERRRVALANLLISRPDLAVLDEPTNHLDAETSEWLEQYLLAEHPGAVLLITHDRYLLEHVVTRTVEVADGEVHEYDGGYERYLAQKSERLAHAARAEQNRQNFLRRELEWLRRQPKARTTKQTARIERAEAAKAVSKPKVEQVHGFEVDLSRSGKTILELRELAAEIGGRSLFSGLDLFVTEGERIGIVGANATGKTTLLRILVGELAPSAGSVTVGKSTRIAYFDQQRSGLDDSKSVFDNVMGEQSTIELGGEIVEPRSYLERFGFDGHKLRQPVGSLSGGERARVALARLLRQSTNLIVMDEPTNDLDVATLGALEAMLVESGATALIVTHDRWFLDRVATGILAFDGAGRVVRYPGNYQTFKSLSAEAKAKSPLVALGAGEEEGNKPSAPPRAPKKGLSFAEARELEGLLDAVEQAEGRVAELMARLSEPATYANGASDVPALNAELATAKAQAQRLTLRWEELETKRES